MERQRQCGSPRLYCLLSGLLLLCGCSALGRRINQALPEFMRSKPGESEMAIFAAVKKAREWTPEELQAQDKAMAEAKSLLARKEWGPAEDVLEAYLEDYPESKRDEEARFLLGQTYYQDDEYGKAFRAFKDFNSTYAVSDYSSQVMEYQYKMGMAYMKGERSTFFGLFSNRSTGEKFLNYVVERYPNGSRAADAQWALSEHYRDGSDWEKASDAYKFLADNYPNSEWFAAARYYSAYCRYRLVKGAVYDPQIMLRVRSDFEQYLREAPKSRWVARAQSFRDEIVELQGQHLLGIGTWYLGQGKPFSARYYLESARVRFPSTKAAARAAELLKTVPGAETGEETPAKSPANKPVKVP